MLIAPPTHNEAQRLALLRSLDILDSDPEPAFDALTRMTAQMLDVPIALISLVDENRQWFKSRVGLDDTETPRSISFCAHAIHGTDTFVIPDATRDDRFADNPAVTGGPNVRAYAGVPLLSADGLALGTLCAVDDKPREFSESELKLLRDFAEIAQRELLHREAAVQARGVAEENERVVSDNEALYNASFEHAAIGIGIVGLDGRWMRINPKLVEILGRRADELAQLSFQQITHPDDLDIDLGYVKQLLEGKRDNYSLEKRYLRPDGSIVWANLTVTLVREDDKPHHYIAVIEDISARKTAEADLHALHQQLEQRVKDRTAELQEANDVLIDAIHQRERSESLLALREAELRAVLENAQDAYIGIDEKGQIIEWNRQAERTFGWTRADALNQRIDTTLVPTEHREAHLRDMAEHARSGDARVLGKRLELPVQCRDGRVIPCEVTITALPPTAKGRSYAAFLHDISERKEAERKLASLAVTDTLTSLPNRRGFEAQFKAALARARRRQQPLALLFLDIDRFKSINDTHGHGVGDAVLKEFAHRLRASLRETDTIARLAGDEFVVIIEGLTEAGSTQAEQVAQKIIATVNQEMLLEGIVLKIGTSIGFALSDGRATPDQVLHRADQALYQSKAKGRNTYSGLATIEG
ncbi:PAS domain S-box protein [Uliginosibacterium sp. H1]|uniref:PAS domain S-box protein n=1 Tax=Uliginosibacterium sp. H1 TaxID=3114757 RepID=UPI002E1988F6|nr:PAS domain S-box protein [Uliginosibacterium sp. H1]